MTDEQKAMRRAWAESHFGDKNLTDEELDCATYMPSENFSDGWDKGVDFALSNQWISVEERLPPCTCLLLCINARKDKGYALCVYIRGRFMIYDHTLSYKREFYPTHWLKVPQLNPEKQSK